MQGVKSFPRKSYSNPMTALNPTNVQLFTYFRSSASWRVRLSLHLKGVPFVSRPVNLVRGEQRETSYMRDVNPNGTVPALTFSLAGESASSSLETEGAATVHAHTLTQSPAILELLEELYPKARALLPPASQPIQRARVRELCALIGCDIHPIQNLRVLKKYGGDDLEKRSDWARHWISQGFIALEELLVKSAGTYSVGDSITLADLFLVPQVYNAGRFSVDLTPFPTIQRIVKSLEVLPEFVKAHPDSQEDSPPPPPPAASS